MPGVPQSHLLNPATQPRCGFYLGLPLVSPLQLNVENSAFSVNDVLWYDGDSTITFMHPDADQDKFLDNFGKSNYISTDVSTNIVSFGFRSGDMYFTYEITQRVSIRASYPGDMIRLALKGNEEGDEFDLSGFGVNAFSYLELSMGVSRKLSDILHVGYKSKILFGQANMSTKRTDITLTTDEDWIVRSKFDINATLPGVIIPTDADGNFKYDDIDFEEDLQTSDYIKMATGNFGLALDLGVHFKPIEKLTLSASILDLGFIKWKNYTFNITQDAEFIFDGIEVEFNDSTDFGENLLDSLENTFVLNETENSYSTFLPAKIYLGVKYDIIDEISVSALSRTEFYKGRLRQQFNLSANFYPIKMVAASINYSIMNKTFNNFGLGLALKAGPFNWYMISDNLPLVFAVEQSSGVPIPHKTRTLNFRIGFNLVFGCAGTKKITRDMPLIY
jgi:hypothetical protein